MPTTRTARAAERKVPKTYRLNPNKVAAAQRILGTPTATETIEAALDMVVFRQELIEGTRALRGVELTSPDAADR
jgi:Arc/MetJ family transcription regulator